MTFQDNVKMAAQFLENLLLLTDDQLTTDYVASFVIGLPFMRNRNYVNKAMLRYYVRYVPFEHILPHIERMLRALGVYRRGRRNIDSGRNLRSAVLQMTYPKTLRFLENVHAMTGYTIVGELHNRLNPLSKAVWLYMIKTNMQGSYPWLNDVETVKAALDLPLIDYNPLLPNGYHGTPRALFWSWVSPQISEMKSLVLKLVSKDGMALEHTIKSMRCDPEIVAAAVRQNPQAAQFSVLETEIYNADITLP